MLDLGFVAAVVGVAVVGLARPWIGLCAYTFVSLAFPHRMIGGVAFDFPAAKLLGISTLLGMMLTTEWQRWPRAREFGFLAVLFAVCCVSTFSSALAPEVAREKLIEFTKTLVMLVPAVVLLQDSRRFRVWLGTIAASLALLGCVTGYGGIVTRLQERLFGPMGSVVGDNNALGFALAVGLPLLAFHSRLQGRGWRRVVIEVAFVLTLIAIPATYSRGAFVVAAVTLPLVLLVAYDRRLTLVAVMSLVAIVWLTPPQLEQRLATIRPGVQRSDASGVQRMHAWYVAWRLGLDHPWVGAGFRPFSEAVYERYIPGYRARFNAHNLFLQVFAEQGLLGLGSFVGMLAASLYRLLRLVRRARDERVAAWVGEYASMLMLALLAYLAGGVFLHLPYFELLYWLITAAVLLDVIASRPAAVVPATNGESMLRRVGRGLGWVR